MKAAAILAGAGIAGALALAAPAVVMAEDHEAGVPLTPAEAVGTWTVESGGQSICVLSLGDKKVATMGYVAQVPATCGDAVPAQVAAWAPAAGGMSLVGADGQPVMGFSRWSNSLFVSHRSSGVDIQLKRGGPGV